MALVHEKLYQSESLARVDFAEYAQSLLNYLWRAHGEQAANVKCTLDAQPVSALVDSRRFSAGRRGSGYIAIVVHHQDAEGFQGRGGRRLDAPALPIRQAQPEEPDLQNSLPWPRPSLNACTLPPCFSTSCGPGTNRYPGPLGAVEIALPLVKQFEQIV